MSVSISKHSVVLSRISDPAAHKKIRVGYALINPDTGFSREIYRMAMLDYQALGEPEEITVTIERGNTLENGAIMADTATKVQNVW